MTVAGEPACPLRLALDTRDTDGAAGQINCTWMTPAFKAGNYEKGIEDGVEATLRPLPSSDLLTL